MRLKFTPKLVRIVILIFTTFYLMSCTPVPYKDVTNESKYKHFLGMEFYTANEVYATGVTFDQNYKKRIDYIFLVPLPGFTGPEVVFRKLLAKGQKLRILGILSSSYNIFFKQYFLKVKVVNTNIYDKYTVIIDVDDTFVELAK